MKSFASGLEHAEGAQLAGAEALEELSFRVGTRYFSCLHLSGSSGACHQN